MLRNKAHSCCHHGVSLIEVLVSMFILAIGLLSIASLLPVGQSQVALAEIEERSSIMAQNAFRDFKIRGYSNPLWWIDDPTGSRISVVNSVIVNTATPPFNPQVAFADTSGGSAPYPKIPIFIDPYMASVSSQLKSVPHTVGTRLFPRYSVKDRPKFTVYNSSTNTNGYLPITSLVAESIFAARDDLINEKPNPSTPEAAAPPNMEMSGSIALRRGAEGNFSWMAMLMPSSTLPVSPYIEGQPYPGQQCELSIIVFHQRSQTLLTNERGSNTERELSVVTFDGSGINGGEVTFTSASGGSAADLLIRPGDWMLLYGSRPVPASGTPTHYINEAKWYKILSAETDDPAAPLTSRQITLIGPDWDVTTFTSTVTPGGTTRAFVFDGAVGVYTKSIRLEGFSQLNNWDGN